MEKYKKKRVFSQFLRTITRRRRENLIKRVRKKRAQKKFFNLCDSVRQQEEIKMSLDRKKSDCNVQQQQQQQHHQQHENPSGSNECLLQKRSTKHRDSLSKKSDQTVPRMYSGDDVEVLRLELETETRNR